MAAGHDLKSTQHSQANVPETKHIFDRTLEKQDIQDGGGGIHCLTFHNVSMIPKTRPVQGFVLTSYTQVGNKRKRLFTVG